MNKSIRRFLAIAVALVLALILAGIADFTISYANDPGQDVSGGDSPATDATLAFGDSSSRNGNVVSVPVGTNKTVTITVSGTNSYNGFEWDGDSATLKYHSSRKGDIQFALGGNFDASTMSVSLIGPNNYHQAFASLATVSMSPDWILPNAVQFSISETSGQGGGSDPSGGGGNNQLSSISVTVNINVTGEHVELNDVSLYATGVDSHPAGRFNPSSGGTEVIEGSSDGKYTIKLSTSPGIYIRSATVNNVNAEINGDQATLADFSVADHATLNIAVTLEMNTSYTLILWTYDAADADRGWSDAYVDPETGTVEVTKVMRGNNVIFDLETANWEVREYGPDRWANMWSSNDHTVNISQALSARTGGVITNWHVECQEGDVVTYHFVPKPGFQLTSASLNGFVLTPQREQCTYTLAMRGRFHLSGVFSSTPVQTSITSSQNVSGLTVSGTNDSISSGNIAAQVTGGQANPSDDALEAAMGAGAADFHEAVETVDISMINIISKGGSGTYFNNADNYWTNAMSDLSAPATISLDVPNHLAEGETYSIIRNHNGTLEELNAVYNATTGKLTFESDKFSEYTIIKRAGTPVTESSSGSDSSSDSNSGSDSSSDSSSRDETTADPEGTVTIPTEVIGETTLPAEEVKALGVTFAPVITASTETIYSVYNPYTGEIVYTPDAAEKNALVSSGWTDQGILWDTSKDPTVAAPVYRLYNPITGEHFYTINQNEVIACAKMGFTFEGSAFHVPLKGKLIPVYRMFCSKVAAGAHRFVEDETEVARLEATGNWVKEGIAWYTIAK